jgi:hypothetical protein
LSIATTDRRVSFFTRRFAIRVERGIRSHQILVPRLTCATFRQKIWRQPLAHLSELVAEFDNGTARADTSTSRVRGKGGSDEDALYRDRCDRGRRGDVLMRKIVVIASASGNGENDPRYAPRPVAPRRRADRRAKAPSGRARGLHGIDALTP